MYLLLHCVKRFYFYIFTLETPNIFFIKIFFASAFTLNSLLTSSFFKMNSTRFLTSKICCKKKIIAFYFNYNALFLIMSNCGESIKSNRFCTNPDAFLLTPFMGNYPRKVYYSFIIITVALKPVPRFH